MADSVFFTFFYGTSLREGENYSHRLKLLLSYEKKGAPAHYRIYQSMDIKNTNYLNKGMFHSGGGGQFFQDTIYEIYVTYPGRTKKWYLRGYCLHLGLILDYKDNLPKSFLKEIKQYLDKIKN
jgi:hypothetical protein